MQTILADTAGGLVLRRFLPVTLVLPVVLGWIRLWGQRAGLYDTAFGLAIMVDITDHNDDYSYMDKRQAADGNG